MKTILVIDDDPGMRESLRLNLEDAGYNIVTCADGQEAIDLIFEVRKKVTYLKIYPPDLILTDLDMPRIDGFGLREYCGRNNIITPMILMTGNASLVNAIEAKKRGFAGFIAKPFQIDDLLAEIHRVLDEEQDAKYWESH